MARALARRPGEGRAPIRRGGASRARGGRSGRRLEVSAFLPDPVEAGETRGDYGAGAHLFPFRTEKLSPAATMILR